MTEAKTPREIDALVAANVFRWKWYNPRGACSVFCSPDSKVSYPDCLSDTPHANPEMRLGLSNVPEYSTDPYMSKQILSEMLSEGWNCTIVLTGDGCHVEFKRPSDMGFGEAFVEDSMEMAVCLAALRAKGVEV